MSPYAWAASAQEASPGQAIPAAPAKTAGSAAADDSDQIVVTALPTEQTSIDRTTYVVRDNAESRSSTVLDVLSHVPSVEVTPSGQLRLLGRSGVKILIDGREVTNPLAVLGNLQGSQIVKIEIISNPSAQFSAQGTAGIINVITRRAAEGGLRGSLTASAGTLGNYDAKVSPTWSTGKLSLSASLGLSRTAAGTDFERDRRDSDSGAFRQHEAGTSQLGNTNLTGSLFATYRLSSRETLSSTLIGIHGDGARSQQSEIQSPELRNGIVRQTREQRSRFESRDYSLEYRREGSRKGETLTVSAQRSSNRLSVADRFTGQFTGPGADTFLSSDFAVTRSSSLKVDLNRPSGRNSLLTAGILLEKRYDASSTLATGILLSGLAAIQETTDLRGSSFDKAAYVTYQRRLSDFTILPGIRIESRHYKLPPIAGPGPEGTHVFPTLHVERGLGRSTHIDLSYSRRIAWPDIGSLYPFRRFADTTNADIGNIQLRPEITDAYEAKLSTVVERQSVDATAYWRRTQDLFSATSAIDEDGVLVRRKVNLGILSATGLNVSLRGPIGAGLSYSATGDIAVDSIEGNVPDPLFRTSGTRLSLVTQLEYRDGKRDRPGADHITLSYRYTGPIDRGAFYYSGYSTVSAVWSHVITDRLAAVANVGRIQIPSGTTVTTYSSEIVERQFYRPAGIKAVVSLTYTLHPASQP
jgi:outer membrane receptor protein involved in Fe transport